MKPRFIETRDLSRYGHPEIRFAWVQEEVPEPDMLAFRDLLSKRVADGDVFKDGQTLQIGSEFLRVKLVEDNVLEIQEPDYKSFPICCG